jgi:hypothetical protein
MRCRTAILVVGILSSLLLLPAASTVVTAHEGHGSTPETPLEPSDDTDWPRPLVGGIGAIIVLVTVAARFRGTPGRLEQLLGFGLGTVLVVYGGMAVI